MFDLRKLYRRYIRGKIKEAHSTNFHAIVLTNPHGRKYYLRLSWLKRLRYDCRETIKQDLIDYVNKIHKVKREDIIFIAYLDPWSSDN